MATAAEIQVAYRAIYRTDLNVTVATAIANTGISVDAYIAQQLPQVASTTQAAVAIASFVTGTTPTSDKLDALKVAADAQVASYTQLGSANPSLGAYEAFGRSFATDTTTTAGFNTKYGALSTADFITLVYAQVYGTTPSAGAAANLTAQINYFTNLYTANGVANAALAAKGAVLGQIVGYAFTSSASANSTLDNQVASLLTSAAKGDTSVYAKALPTVVDPGQVGVTITLPGAATDVVSTTVADPALKSTAFNDIINGTYVAGAKIDAGGGEDVANLTVTGVSEPTAAAFVSVETINVTTAGGAAAGFDLKNVTGYKTVGFVDGAATSPGSFAGLLAGTALTVTDTTPGAAPIGQNFSFALKDSSGTSDVANLTVNGLNNGQTITLSGYETINVTASGVDSTTATGFGIIDADAKALNITATKAASIALTTAALESITGTGAGAVTLTTLPNTVKTIDFSGSTGANTILAVGTGTTSIKGGSGVDTFGGITKSGTIVTTGGGNDSVTFTLGNANDTGTVTGGVGADALNLGATGKVTVIYTSAADSTNANFDTVTNFNTGSDKVDLKALALAGDKTAINTFASASAIANGTDYFQGKAVAFGTFGAVADTYLLADVNNNGVFDVNTDLIVKLSGAPVIGDIVFA